jgi:hypothetical protein
MFRMIMSLVIDSFMLLSSLCTCHSELQQKKSDSQSDLLPHAFSQNV